MLEEFMFPFKDKAPFTVEEAAFSSIASLKRVYAECDTFHLESQILSYDIIYRSENALMDCTSIETMYARPLS